MTAAAPVIRTLDDATAFVQSMPVGSRVSAPDGLVLERFAGSGSGYRWPWRPVGAGEGAPASDAVVAGWVLAGAGGEGHPNGVGPPRRIPCAWKSSCAMLFLRTEPPA